jgi:hypothetical protein
MDETSIMVLSGEFVLVADIRVIDLYKPIVYTSHDDLTASPYNVN